MEFQVHVWLLEKLIKLCKDETAKEYLSNAVRYESSTKKVKINSLELTSADLRNLAELAQKHYDKNVPDKNDKAIHNKFYPFVNLSRKVLSALELENAEGGDLRVKSLDQIPLAMKTFLKQHPHKIIFKKNSDGWMLPYVISDVNYDKPRQGFAKTTITAKAFYRGSSISTSHTWDSARKTCSQLLKEAGWVLATDELIESYSKRIERYRKLQPLIGQQVNLTNIAKSDSRWVPMTVDGRPTKAVIDDTSDDREDDKIGSVSKQKIHFQFWRDVDVIPLEIFADVVEIDGSEPQDEDDTRQYTALPIHPYIKCFDLNKHRYVSSHIANIVDYEWDHNLADKLILDEETKSLIEILVDSTKSRSEDIISGKMSGTIVLATGSPGVGKTLTAEVFSEKIEKSLYVVQCSQLGIDIDSIEKKLASTLDRASRWGSILLIDEADVYIRDRGEDIVHNAIVGVFLRLIEYYNGVLFMTSNRGDIIDDAIISRATAWIQYKLPNEELLSKIWQVLAKQFEVDISDKQIKQLVKEIPSISGRTVRNLLKLVKALDYEELDGVKQQEANFHRLMKASKFQKLDQI